MKVTRVELRDIQPSQGVQQAMEKQMTAEREKRASIKAASWVADSARALASSNCCLAWASA
ncbi:MAG: SPFH domain-containing protein [Cyanobium sp.]